jgi:hypothetical protein
MKYILIYINIMASCTFNAAASVDLNMGYYNSFDDMAMSLEGSNLDFGSSCILMPQSITYDNGGASNQPQAEYSYSLALNEERAFSSAETDSGMFAFYGAVRTGGENNENLMKISANSGVKDGRLNVAYGNDEFEVQETVEAEDSVYQQKADISPTTVSSSGFGSTINPVPGLAENLMARWTGQVADEANEDANPVPQEGKDQGIRYSINVHHVETGKLGYVDANVMGLTEAQLATNVHFEDDEYLFGVKVRGIGFAPIDELNMTGQASGLPVQTLPPGDVEIRYITNKSYPWDEYVDLVDIESEKFSSEYPGNSTPALWYYLDNEFRIEVPVYVNYTLNNSLAPLEIYEFGMVYNVGGASSIYNDSL